MNIKDTLTERGNRYGSFAEHARITQSLKDTMELTPKWPLLTNSQKEALEMVAHKIGRILNGDPFYIESWRDAIGYLQLVINELESTEGATDGKVSYYTVVNGKLTKD